jgi:hypothetical protein
MNRLKQTLVRWLTLVGLFFVLTGCASGQGAKLVNHSFNFDGWYDGWQGTVELLEYAYGDQYSMVRNKASDGRSAGVQSGVSGPMPVGEFLFVKWRIKTTGEVLEQRVDLRERLPKDMTNHELTFLVDGRQLFVYVVTPERKKSYGEPPVLKTWRSNFAKAYEVFPSIQR